MFRNESRLSPVGLPDLLMPFALVEDGILLQQDGSLVAAWAYRGPDMASASHAEMAALSERLNHALKMDSGWMVQCDAIRSEAPGYPEAGAFPDPVTTLIDEERRQQFLRESAHYESEYFLTLTYLPPSEQEEKAKGWFFGETTGNSAAKAALDTFRAKVEAFENIFGALFAIQRLRRVVTSEAGEWIQTRDELLRYFRRCIAGEDHPFTLPEFPVYVNEAIGSEDFYGGVAPRIGRKHICVVAIEGFPQLSWPGILSSIDNLAIEYRWNTRAIMLGPEDARNLLMRNMKRWRGKARGLKGSIVKGAGELDGFAVSMAADSQSAMDSAASGNVRFCLYTSTVILLNEDPQKLADDAREIRKTIQNLGFACRVEDINAVEAWRGSLPGDGYSNVRRVPLHTLNLADMLPLAAVWAGLRENPSALMPPHSPPLLFAATTGSTPFRFNLHVSDLGHTIVAGPSGAGKSTALGLFAAQWFRYPRAQVFAFDKGYSIWTLTHAAGGDFYDIAGKDSGIYFCPLKYLAHDSDVTWAVEWVESLCVLNGLRITPDQRNAISEAVSAMSNSPSPNLTELWAYVQDRAIKSVLEYYTSGPSAAILNAQQDSLRDGRFLSFETEHLLQLGDKVVLPVLLYLFRRIEQRLDGSPTLIILDEAWAYFRHSLFREKLRDWLKTMRRKNAVVVMATQQISDLAETDIATVVLENCPTKILLPNAEAMTPNSREFYHRVGLKDAEYQIIQRGIPKKNYYVISPLGRREISLGIHKVALSFVGVNGAEQRLLIREMMSKHPHTWRAEWLRHQSLPQWADYLEVIQDSTHCASHEEEEILCG